MKEQEAILVLQDMENHLELLVLPAVKFVSIQA